MRAWCLFVALSLSPLVRGGCAPTDLAPVSLARVQHVNCTPFYLDESGSLSMKALEECFEMEMGLPRAE